MDMASIADIVGKTPHGILMNLWLHAEDGSPADDILFHARMYISLGEEKYPIWKQENGFPNTTQAIFYREETNE